MHPVKVSICVLVYNHERYIVDCLESIAAQCFDFSYEVLVGEDCSTDSSRSLIMDYSRRNPNVNFKYVYREKNIGGSANMLDLYYSASGEYVAHLDGDDLILPNKLQRQVEFLNSNPDVAVCGHFMKIMDFDGNIRASCFPSQKFDRLAARNLVLLGMPCANSSLMFRRSALPSLNRQGVYLDWYILFSLLKVGELGFVNETLGIYRFNPSSAVSVLGPKGLKQLMLQAHARAFSERPDLQAEFACVALIDVLIDLYHFCRPSVRQLAFLWRVMCLAAIPMVYSTYQRRKAIAKALTRW